MAHDRDPVCFTCSNPTSHPQRNKLANGRACPSCQDRVLDALPSLLPNARGEERSGENWEIDEMAAHLELSPGDSYPEPPMPA